MIDHEITEIILSQILNTLGVLLLKFKINLIKRIEKMIGMKFLQGYYIGALYSNFNMNFKKKQKR